MEEKAEGNEELGSDEYIEVVDSFANQDANLDMILLQLGIYMSDDLESGKSQDECLENGLGQLEENEGITQSDIFDGADAVNSLYTELQPARMNTRRCSTISWCRFMTPIPISMTLS